MRSPVEAVALGFGVAGVGVASTVSGCRGKVVGGGGSSAGSKGETSWECRAARPPMDGGRRWGQRDGAMAARWRARLGRAVAEAAGAGGGGRRRGRREEQRRKKKEERRREEEKEQ